MKSSIFPGKTLAIASAAVGILFIGGFLISGDQPVQSKQTYNAPAKNHLTTTVTTINTKPSLQISDAIVKTKPVTRKKDSPKTAVEAVDTGKSITNPEDATPIDEMVVMGMADQANKAIVASIREAHPKMGWSDFKTYIKEKAVSPDGKTGVVKVEFTVNIDGTCNDFKVKSGLTEVADQKAIELIKEGPSWVGNADGQATETTVNVEFH